MLPIIIRIQETASAALFDLFGITISPSDLTIQETKKEFEGDYTLVVFSLAKYKLGAPAQIAEKLGKELVERCEFLDSYNVIQGFLNLSATANYWKSFIVEHQTPAQWEAFLHSQVGVGKKIMVEFCSPNTNKPLHLGHLRNLMLGDAIIRIYKAAGYETIPVCLYNDRGTAICKSMFAYQKLYNGITPETYPLHPNKGDKLIGDCYVAFAKILEQEVEMLVKQGMPEEEAKKNAPANIAIQEMLIAWEKGDPEIRSLWKKMNDWVYEANAKTFQKLGISFQRFYYESDLYELGRDTVMAGLESGVFEKKENGAIGIDLTEDGLDFKVLVRGNGTTVYMTQDLGTADMKYHDFHAEKSIYVVGNEQDYHFKALFLIMKKLGRVYADGMYHLSYGMVDLPTGKMKSREGTTVEADDLIEEVQAAAKQKTLELGKTDDMSKEEINTLSTLIGLGALKYFLLKVDTQKRMVFDPKESVDLQGNTGPFIQYSYTRIASVQREAQARNIAKVTHEMKIEESISPAEKQLVKTIYRYPQVLQEAVHTYNPALIANYCYEVAKEYNRFYHECRILVADKPNLSAIRFALSNLTGETLKHCLSLLGIDVPERM